MNFECVAMSALIHLECIGFPDSRYITDLETMATKLKNLKQIHFVYSNLNHVKMFVDANSKSEEIRIDLFMEETGKIEHHKVLDLIGLNKKRVNLPNAKKITIFVDETVYLATKLTRRITDLDFIKLKRTDSSNGTIRDFGHHTFY